MDIISPLLLLLFLTIPTADITADWWTWVMGNNQTNLLLDPTGEMLMKYQPQNQDYYFLTGAYGSNMTRNVTIPADQSIIVPVLNGFTGCECNLFQRVIHAVEAHNDVHDIVKLEARLDGKDIPFKRLTSDIFPLTIKDDKPFLYLKDRIGDTLATVADGYWVVIQDGQLEQGKQYELYTHGIARSGYSTEVRYNIEIS